MSLELADTADQLPGNTQSLIDDLKSAVAQPASQSTDPAQGNQKTTASLDVVVPNDEQIPAKLRGKTLAELIDVYRNTESALGRANNDLGTQRKLTDRLLDLKRADDLQTNGSAKPSTAPVEVSSTDLLSDPTKTLDQVIKSHPLIANSPTAQKLQQLEAQLAEQQFVAKHPDYANFVGNAEFDAWVQASPIRARAAQVAAAGDYAIAADLLTEYKSQARPAAAAAAPAKTVEAARNVGLESGSAAAPANSAGGSGKAGKVYRRVDLINLKLTRPDFYSDPAFQAEIMQAYAEGRVK